MRRKAVGRSGNAMTDLTNALDRLIAGTTLIVRAPYRINQAAVCAEAGRHRSSIKRTEEFTQLRRDIAAAARIHDSKPGKRKKDTLRLLKKVERLGAEKRHLEKALDEAAVTIYRLHYQLQAHEADRDYLLGRVSDARKTSKAVDRVFTLMNFDDFLDERQLSSRRLGS